MSSELSRKNAILIDWLSFTTTEYSPNELIELLGMGKLLWENRSGFYGYRERLWCGSISIHFGGSEKMGVLVEMSGQGCRTFESVCNCDYNVLFAYIMCGKFNLTRLDVAFDEYEGILDIDKLCKDTLAQKYRSPMSYYNVQQSSQGKSIDIGSYKSDVMIRIYDKLAERISKMRSSKDKERTKDDIPHWIRVELQMRDDRAKEFIRKYVESKKEDIGVIYKGVLRRYLEYGYYRTDNDEGKRVFSTFAYWENLLESSERISLYIAPGVDYNLERLVNYVTNISGNAIDCMFNVFGVEETVQRIKERSVKSSFKYINIININNEKKKNKEKKENESNSSGN